MLIQLNFQKLVLKILIESSWDIYMFFFINFRLFHIIEIFLERLIQHKLVLFQLNLGCVFAYGHHWKLLWEIEMVSFIVLLNGTQILYLLLWNCKCINVNLLCRDSLAAFDKQNNVYLPSSGYSVITVPTNWNQLLI